MDVVNHILIVREKMNEEESDLLPMLNYLFLDEVQDLPPAVIYLIASFFNNGLYFSGDTAQAIHKGVSFKFSDIGFMFRK